MALIGFAGAAVTPLVTFFAYLMYHGRHPLDAYSIETLLSETGVYMDASDRNASLRRACRLDVQSGVRGKYHEKSADSTRPQKFASRCEASRASPLDTGSVGMDMAACRLPRTGGNALRIYPRRFLRRISVSLSMRVFFFFFLPSR